MRSRRAHELTIKPHLDGYFVRLHGQIVDRSVLDRALDPPLIFRSDVLHEHRVVHDCRDTGARRRKLALEKHGGVGALDLDGYLLRYRDRALEEPEPVVLVGPHKGAKRERPFRARRIDRIDVTTLASDDLDLDSLKVEIYL